MAERLPTPAEQSGVPFVSKARMAKAKARVQRIRDHAEQMWDEILAAHDEQDYIALGHTTFKGYVEIELDLTARSGYRLLDQARMTKAIAEHSTRDARVTPSGRQAGVLRADMDESAREIAADVDAGVAPARAVQAAVAKRVLETTATRLDKRGQGILEPTSQQGEDVDDGAGRDHSGSPADSPGAVATTREVAEAPSESEPDTREQHPDPAQGIKAAGTPEQSVSLVAACKRILLADGAELGTVGAALLAEVVDHLRQHTFKPPKAKPSTAPRAPAPALGRYGRVLPMPTSANGCKHERKKQRKGASGMTITECPDCELSW